MLWGFSQLNGTGEALLIAGKSMKMRQFALVDEMAWGSTFNAERELGLLTKSCQRVVVVVGFIT